MEKTPEKKRIRLGEIKKTTCCAPAPEAAGESGSGCCPPPPKQKDTGAPEPCCATAPGTPTADKAASTCCSDEPRGPQGPRKTEAPVATKVTAEWTETDRLNHLRCRLGAYRMRYAVAPGLYAIGEPDASSDVFVSANYKMSFDHLRKALDGTSSWILVLDTKGINVWCAAGKGTFGTDELVERIRSVDLGTVVAHRRIILPQLSAPGVAAHTVKRKTGFMVHYGPVRAADIKAYVEAEYRATNEMRTVGFSFLDRLVLTPMEINPAMKRFPFFALAVLLVFGLTPSGISFGGALARGWPFLLLGLVSVFSGAFFTPLFLGQIPSRAFSVKGLLTGILFTAAVSAPLGVYSMSPLLVAAVFTLFPALSSYMAVQFTGSTVFTGLSGVKKELRYAIPLYMAALVVTVILITAYKVREWGLV